MTDVLKINLSGLSLCLYRVKNNNKNYLLLEDSKDKDELFKDDSNNNDLGIKEIMIDNTLYDISKINLKNKIKLTDLEKAGFLIYYDNKKNVPVITSMHKN